MTFLTPAQDFVERTLAALPGDWARLRYVAGLRENGRYSHWGLGRVYGDEAAHRAIADAHRQVWLRILRTPLAEAVRDLQCSARAAERTFDGLLEEIVADAARLLPLEDGGGSPRHFNSIVTAISALLRAPTRSSQPAA